MAEARAERRLVAILAADVVGYSTLMERNEAGTLATLKSRRATILQPIVSQHRGRIVKLMGDGVLIEFASAVDAVDCAVSLQEAMRLANGSLVSEDAIILRVGVNLGDVVVEGADIYGDGVNIASRLERAAAPGEIYVSQSVFSNVRGKVRAGFYDLGEQHLKNLQAPVRIYRVIADDPGIAPPARTDITSTRLSVAVLPFANMSGDPDQEYFSDGIAEDIITDLSKVLKLSVVSRNSSFVFKGKSVDIRQMGRQLNVAFVAEGSVRKTGERVRITAQLVDAKLDSHVWAERFDRDMKDIFAIQDDISAAIVAALKIKLLPEEKKAIETRSTRDPRAYELYLLARSFQPQYTARLQASAIYYAQRALEIDPEYARAWAVIASCQAFAYSAGVSPESGLAAAEKALSLDPTLAQAHAAKARALAESGHLEEALASHLESLRLEPDSFDVQAGFARTCMHLGRYEDALTHFERAAQLDEENYSCVSMVVTCYQALGRQQEAKSAMLRSFERMEKAVAQRPDNAHALSLGAGDLAYLGQMGRAREWAERALAIDPNDLMTQYNVVCALCHMDECDRALELLEAYLEKVPAARINWIRRDPDLAPLYGFSRYQDLIKRGEARLALEVAGTERNN